MLPNLASESRPAFSRMVSNTGCKSLCELEIARSTSAVAVCCSNASVSSSVRCSTFCSRSIGFLQPAGHVVELIGQRLDLVACLDGDALTELAAADARGAGAQGLDRHRHPSGERHAGDEGEQKCTEQHQPGALNGCVKRCICFGGRCLDEHKPAERRDR